MGSAGPGLGTWTDGRTVHGGQRTDGPIEGGRMWRQAGRMEGWREGGRRADGRIADNTRTEGQTNKRREAVRRADGWVGGWLEGRADWQENERRGKWERADGRAARTIWNITTFHRIVQNALKKKHCVFKILLLFSVQWKCMTASTDFYN